MDLFIEPMRERDARAIVAWRYEDEYVFYNMDLFPEDMGQFLNPKSWPGSIFSVKDKHEELVGFFEFHADGDTVTVGLGMRPGLTGKGLGLGFLSHGLDFARQEFDCATFRMEVASFNRRAIRVYGKAGFQPRRTFTKHTSEGDHEFLEMTRGA